MYVFGSLEDGAPTFFPNNPFPPLDMVFCACKTFKEAKHNSQQNLNSSME
uniref:Uncharacterized protein n=1 Tax=Rhizophora mucronata TaxID=61149 RepID=A0A2P2J9Z5_RHIMU